MEALVCQQPWWELQLERRLRERLEALGPVPRAELLHVLMLADFGSNNLGPT